MLKINENLFSKEIVKSFFDLKIKVKYAILRLKNLEYYIGKEKAKRYLLELEEFNKDIEDYMEIYNERFQRTALIRNLELNIENNQLNKNIKHNIDFLNKPNKVLHKNSTKSFIQK